MGQLVAHGVLASWKLVQDSGAKFAHEEGAEGPRPTGYPGGGVFSGEDRGMLGPPEARSPPVEGAGPGLDRERHQTRLVVSLGRERGAESEDLGPFLEKPGVGLVALETDAFEPYVIVRRSSARGLPPS